MRRLPPDFHRLKVRRLPLDFARLLRRLRGLSRFITPVAFMMTPM